MFNVCVVGTIVHNGSTEVTGTITCSWYTRSACNFAVTTALVMACTILDGTHVLCHCYLVYLAASPLVDFESSCIAKCR